MDEVQAPLVMKWYWMRWREEFSTGAEQLGQGPTHPFLRGDNLLLSCSSQQAWQHESSNGH